MEFVDLNGGNFFSIPRIKFAEGKIFIKLFARVQLTDDSDLIANFGHSPGLNAVDLENGELIQVEDNRKVVLVKK